MLVYNDTYPTYGVPGCVKGTLGSTKVVCGHAEVFDKVCNITVLLATVEGLRLGIPSGGHKICGAHGIQDGKGELGSG